ncbi:MAG: cell division protein SepF [Acutalibacteraceae bacterium]|jgi:cell division inhibitor SepF
MSWIKKFINGTDDDYEEPEIGVDYDPEREYPDGNPQRGVPYPYPASEYDDKVVPITGGGSKPHVVFKKLDRYEDAMSVADVINEKRLVVLNLETCQPDIAKRILDFLYGAAYANKAEIKRIADRAYVITPYNIPLSGELLDDVSGRFHDSY